MKKVIIFGYGDVAQEAIRKIPNSEAMILAIADNDKNKWGKRIGELEIINPELIKNYTYDLILICTNLFYKEIYNQLVYKLNILEERIYNYLYFSRKNLLDYYKNHPDEINDEKRGVINYINGNKCLKVFNYPFAESNNEIAIYHDEIKKLFYTIYFGKKMYLKKSFNTKEKASSYCNSLLIEQNIDSPHRYIDDFFNVNTGDVVLDAGVAEGNFALEIIDRVKHLYLIEADEEWIEALEYTFEPYKEKVTIINKFLGEISTDTSVTIDSISESAHIDFIKMDIEGMEYLALKGGKTYLKSNKSIKIAVCAYHNHEDEKKLSDLIHNYGFDASTTKGYMVFLDTDVEPKKLVRGIIRGIK